MDATATAPLLRFFGDLQDPRRPNIRHLFTDLLTIAIVAVLCRSDDWDEVVIWAKANLDWLKSFLSLPRGVPSADTFERLFARIDPRASFLIGMLFGLAVGLGAFALVVLSMRMQRG